MKQIRWVLLILIIQCGSLLATPDVGPPNFAGAKWIWDENAGEQEGTWAYRKGFAFPAGKKPVAAKLAITCDNRWTLYVNGYERGKSNSDPNSWKRPIIVDLSEYLTIEQNAIAVEGTNIVPGPSGLLVKMKVVFEDGSRMELVCDESWISTRKPEQDWQQTGFVAGDAWARVAVRGEHGIAPWGKLSFVRAKKAGKPKRVPQVYPKETEFAGEIYENGVVFVSDSNPLASPGEKTYVQHIKGTRAYFELDPMTPAAIGDKLWSLIPFRPDGKRTLLYDAKGGYVGSPSVSYDGQTVYFSLVEEGEAYFHIYAIRPDGSDLRQITSGPFHRYDPVELPDGRIAFSSTRIGSREEYHAKYASSLFACNPDGSNVRPITYHIVADREPRVTADGSLAFLRMDNFMERAKVEVHLHQTHLDGSFGQVIVGPNRGGVGHDRDAAAEHPLSWLRKYGADSPAPMPCGEVLAINDKGLVSADDFTGKPVGSGFLPYDLSPLPDGQVLCTARNKKSILVFDRVSEMFGKSSTTSSWRCGTSIV